MTRNPSFLFRRDPLRLSALVSDSKPTPRHYQDRKLQRTVATVINFLLFERNKTKNAEKLELLFE
jgi:hypothetical protein